MLYKRGNGHLKTHNMLALEMKKNRLEKWLKEWSEQVVNCGYGVREGMKNLDNADAGE